MQADVPSHLNNVEQGPPALHETANLRLKDSQDVNEGPRPTNIFSDKEVFVVEQFLDPILAGCDITEQDIELLLSMSQLSHVTRLSF